MTNEITPLAPAGSFSHESPAGPFCTLMRQLIYNPQPSGHCILGRVTLFPSTSMLYIYFRQLISTNDKTGCLSPPASHLALALYC